MSDKVKRNFQEYSGLSEDDWNALDDDERTHNNYLDYKADWLKSHPEENWVTGRYSGKKYYPDEYEETFDTQGGWALMPVGMYGSEQFKNDPTLANVTMSAKELDEGFNRYNELKNKKDRTPEEEEEMNKLKWTDANFKNQGQNRKMVDGNVYYYNTTTHKYDIPGTNTKTEGNLSPTDVSFDSGKVNKYRPKSIMSSYYDGDFGDPDSDEAKDSRNYLLANTLGTFARNLGKDFGNVGAQYSGGSIDNNRETDQWKQMQMKQADPEWQAQQEARERDNVTRAYNNNMAKLRGDMAKDVMNYVNNAPNDWVRLQYMNVANKMLSGQTLSNEDRAITGVGELLKLLGQG